MKQVKKFLELLSEKLVSDERGVQVLESQDSIVQHFENAIACLPHSALKGELTRNLNLYAAQFQDLLEKSKQQWLLKQSQEVAASSWSFASKFQFKQSMMAVEEPCMDQKQRLEALALIPQCSAHWFAKVKCSSNDVCDPCIETKNQDETSAIPSTEKLVQVIQEYYQALQDDSELIVYPTVSMREKSGFYVDRINSTLHQMLLTLDSKDEKPEWRKECLRIVCGIIQLLMLRRSANQFKNMFLASNPGKINFYTSPLKHTPCDSTMLADVSAYALLLGCFFGEEESDCEEDSVVRTDSSSSSSSEDDEDEDEKTECTASPLRKMKTRGYSRKDVMDRVVLFARVMNVSLCSLLHRYLNLSGQCRGVQHQLNVDAVWLKPLYDQVALEINFQKEMSPFAYFRNIYLLRCMQQMYATNRLQSPLAIKACHSQLSSFPVLPTFKHWIQQCLSTQKSLDVKMVRELMACLKENVSEFFLRSSAVSLSALAILVENEDMVESPTCFNEVDDAPSSLAKESDQPLFFVDNLGALDPEVDETSSSCLVTEADVAWKIDAGIKRSMPGGKDAKEKKSRSTAFQSSEEESEEEEEDSESEETNSEEDKDKDENKSSSMSSNKIPRTQ